MSALTPALRTIAATATFFGMVYLTYICMYLAPTGRVRRWGANTWWLLIRLGPALPAWGSRIDDVAEVGGYDSAPEVESHRRRFRMPWDVAHLPRPFWLGATLCLVIALGIGMTRSAPPSAESFLPAQETHVEQAIAETIIPAQRTYAVEGLAEIILSYLDTWREDDPLVTLPQGSQAKASNYYGVEVGGARYYYQTTHHVSSDPWRLGTVADYEVVSVLSPDSPDEVIIYRIK